MTDLQKESEKQMGREDSTLSLLLVDDERLELETLRDYINWYDLGFDRVYTAGGGREGYDKVQRLQPDVVITDIEMPGINGIEMAKMLYEDRCPAKVIFLTGYDEFEYARTALWLHAEDYILKPFTEKKIRSATERVKASIEKDHMVKSSIESMERNLVERMIKAKKEEALEACAEYRRLKKDKKNLCFGMMKIIGKMEKRVAQQAEALFSEIEYMVEPEKTGEFYALTYSFVSFENTALRVQAWLEEKQIPTVIMWGEEKVPVEKLREQVERMEELKESLRFMNRENTFCVGKAEKIRILEDEEENKKIHEQILDDFKKESSLQKRSCFKETVEKKYPNIFATYMRNPENLDISVKKQQFLWRLSLRYGTEKKRSFRKNIRW